MQNRKIKLHLSLRNYILFGICGILAISSVFMTIETATSGMEMSKIEKDEVLLLDKKKGLEDTIVRTLSLSDLEQKGLELGFTKAIDLVYVSTSDAGSTQAPVANLP
ncbi:MAG TPA: hypothetical protein VFI61_01685 [Patescibacteria group bacterium]|nr:hypothetical protein [Patescibacteria group bacterium]